MGRSPEGSHRKTEDRQNQPPARQTLRREGQGKDSRESWGLGLGSITAAEPGSLVQNRSGLRLSIHLELKGNRRRTVKCTGQSYF